MCGISGVFSVVPLNPVAEQAGLERMRRSLQHRGPDGSGMKLFEHAALVHNRLAIIDLSTGEQPLLNRAGTICIAFNGEIYNYRELRTRYPDYPFRTQSDTEVILAIYESEGIAGFGKLRGMYAFSLWDTRPRERPVKGRRDDLSADIEQFRQRVFETERAWLDALGALTDAQSEVEAEQSYGSKSYGAVERPGSRHD